MKWNRRFTVAMMALITVVITGCEDSPSPSRQAQRGDQLIHQGATDMVRVRIFDDDGNLAPPREMPKVVLSDAQWRQRLSDEQFKVLRGKGTERPFCGGLLNNKEPGVYVCAGCDLPLFRAGDKFDSGTGWPSFFQPLASENIIEHPDRGYGMTRTEILCDRCEGHLGHVFPDGPPPTGQRYCVNSESLRFVTVDKLN